MSATVEDAAEPVVETETDRIHTQRGRKVGLGSDEYGSDYEHPLLKPRLEARKLARLEEEKGDGEVRIDVCIRVGRYRDPSRSMPPPMAW